MKSNEENTGYFQYENKKLDEKQFLKPKKIEKKINTKSNNVINSQKEGKPVINLNLDYDQSVVRENLRISEELVRNDKIKDEMFFSDLFKNNFIKYESSNKCYVCSVESAVLKELLENTKLLKTNNMYSISSIKDMYILQLVAFENELIKLNTEKQSFYHSVVLAKDKLLKEKDEEIKMLCEKLNNKFSRIEKIDQMEMIENQFKRIDDFISSGVKTNMIHSKKARAFNSVLEELNRYKHIAYEILDSYKNNQQNLNLYLEKLANEFPSLTNEIKNDYKSNYMSENYQSNCSVYNSIQAIDKELANSCEENKESKPYGKDSTSSSFNILYYLSNLKRSLENTLIFYDKLLYTEYKKIEIVRKKEQKNGSSHDLISVPDNGMINMTESLSSIRKTVLRKKKIVEDEIECRSQSVGKLWSESLKYSKVENKKSLREIRIAAELRDIILCSFDNIIQSLLNEMVNPSNKSISNNDLVYSARKVMESDFMSFGKGKNLCSICQAITVRNEKKRRSVESLLNRSVNKLSTLSMTDKKKTKNLNDFLLKKA